MTDEKQRRIFERQQRRRDLIKQMNREPVQQHAKELIWKEFPDYVMPAPELDLYLSCAFTLIAEYQWQPSRESREKAEQMMINLRNSFYPEDWNRIYEMIDDVYTMAPQTQMMWFTSWTMEPLVNPEDLLEYSQMTTYSGEMTYNLSRFLHDKVYSKRIAEEEEEGDAMEGYREELNGVLDELMECETLEDLIYTLMNNVLMSWEEVKILNDPYRFTD